MKQVTLNEWKKGDYREVAYLNATADDLSARLPLAFENVEEDGLGMTLLALAKLDDGRQFVLQQFLQAPAPYDQQTAIFCLNDSRTMKTDLQDIFKELNIAASSVASINPAIDIAPASTSKKAAPASSSPKP